MVDLYKAAKEKFPLNILIAFVIGIILGYFVATYVSGGAGGQAVAAGTGLTSGSVISLKSYWQICSADSGTYVKHNMNCNRGSAAAWEKFTITKVSGTGAILSGDLVTLRSYWGYCSSQDVPSTHPVYCNRGSASTWERFRIYKVGGSGQILAGDPIALKSEQWLRYCSSQDVPSANPVNCDRTAIGAWEKFTLTIQTLSAAAAAPVTPACTPSTTAFTPALSTFCGTKNVVNSCGATVSKVGTIICTSPNICVNNNCAVPTCTDFTYSAWSSCVGYLQSRTVLTRLPSGCTGGNPVLYQECSCGEAESSATLCARIGQQCGSLHTGQTCSGATTTGYCGDCTAGYTCTSGVCVAAPTQTCGNSIVEGTEVCDGNSQSCTVNGYAGTQTCNSLCTGFDACIATQYCGDNIKNGNEVCDGTALAGQTCVTKGFASGTLSCNSACTGFITAACCTPSATYTPDLSTFCGTKNVADSCGNTVSKTGTLTCTSTDVCTNNICIPSVNVALATAGATAVASSTYTPAFPASSAINGDRKGSVWGASGGWNDATGAPSWLEVDFSGTKTIKEIDVISVQNNYDNPVEPTLDMVCSAVCIASFNVQYWDGSQWITKQTITDTTKVWNKITFNPITTSKIRIYITKIRATYGRLAEVEAWTG